MLSATYVRSNIMKNKIIYLDNAATTFPKPQKVISAVQNCLSNYCGNPSRGSNPLAVKSAETIYECRTLLGELFCCEPENVIFTYNTTYALNMAIKGAVNRGDHILISNMEHNSTLRPVERLSRDGFANYDIFDVYGKSTDEILSDIDRKINVRTRLLCCVHSSNICSYRIPIKEIGKLCRERGILFICDGAQSGGHIPIDMKNSCIDILCLPSHKGLYGPQGGGIMLLSENTVLKTMIEGGNGYRSLDLSMGDISPEKYEAGTLNTPGIAGLCEGLKFLKARGIDSIGRQNEALFRGAYASLSSISGVKIYDDTAGAVLLFNINGISSDEAGELYNRRSICLRTGFHCSPLAHKALGTPDSGAIRISFGAFNTPLQLSAFLNLTEDISGGKLRI